MTACPHCSQPKGQGYGCAVLPSQEPTERELKDIVVERAIEWHNLASGKLTVPDSARWMVLDDFASAVEDLLRHREAR